MANISRINDRHVKDQRHNGIFSTTQLELNPEHTNIHGAPSNIPSLSAGSSAYTNIATHRIPNSLFNINSNRCQKNLN